MSKIILTSINYSAGLEKEIQVLADQFSLSNEVLVLQHSKYKFKLGKNITTLKIANHFGVLGFLKDLIQLIKLPIKLQNLELSHSRLVIYNPHPFNFLLQIIFKFYKTKSYVALHEPYKSIRELINYELGLSLYLLLANVFQAISILLSTNVILMSPYGQKLFKTILISKLKNDPVQVNLLLNNNKIKNPRKYISFVGRLNKNKGIYDFINIVQYYKKYINKEYVFLIVSSDNISRFIPDDLLNYKNLVLLHKPNLSDETIEDVISKSLVVNILHKSGTQSGVLPLSLSLSTPTLVRDIEPFTQYIKIKNWTLNKEISAIDYFNKLDEIVKNYADNMKYADSLFQKYFDKKNAVNLYKEILK
jgi:glycosyltransferase involved in cell wall biosynthesis|tara:strand:- start:3656 stop:4741 length:1086 start_codon:yes stop_codon:yes gene_type:complete